MNDHVKLIALVGMAGSGKSTAADFFRKNGIPVLRFGDQTDIGVRELGLPLTESNERMYREKIRKELGMAAMAIKIESRIYKQMETDHVIVLDGLYSWEEYIYLIEKFPYLTVLCINASPRIRYERLSKRDIRPLTRDEAKSRDYAEIENLHKAGPIAMADVTIENTGNQSEFIDKLEAFYKTI